MAKKWIAVLLIAIAIAAAGFTYWKYNSGPQQPEKNTVRIALASYPDTSLYLYGFEKGYFRDAGVNLELLSFPWNEQIQATAGGGVDVGMATLDEAASKSRSLRSINKQVLYFLPAWRFQGTIFIAQRGIKPLSELEKSLPQHKARVAFLEQLRGKSIVVPEGGMYDQAIRNFIKTSGQQPEAFQFINAQLETGVNGLSDPNVALAAAGAFERPEAERRGYQIALTPTDLDIVVLTGFIANAAFVNAHPGILQKFATAWYRTVNAALKDQDAAYEIAKKHLDTYGAKVPPLGDYKTALAGNQFPISPTDARSLFLEPSSPAYWHRAWDHAVATLSETGKADQVPLNDADFVGNQVIDSLIHSKK